MTGSQKTTTELIELAERQLADLEAHVSALKAFIRDTKAKRIQDEMEAMQVECTCTPDCVTVCASCREYLEEKEMEF